MYCFENGNGMGEAPGKAGTRAERFFCEALADYMYLSGLGVPEPLRQGRQPVLRKGTHGKPYFLEPELDGVFFSSSDTKGYKVVCFSDSEIGVDCENTEARPGIDSLYGAVAGRCFTGDEQEYVALGASGALLRFFEVWTAKEAYMKYTGNGFSEGFRSFSVFGLPDVDIATGRLDGAPHIVCSVCTERGSVAAQAFEPAPAADRDARSAAARPVLNRFAPGLLPVWQ